MKTKKQIHPAFPFKNETANHTFTGISFRDYFAAAALPVIIKLNGESMEEEKDPTGFVEAVTHMAYAIADGMLKERLKTLEK